VLSVYQKTKAQQEKKKWMAQRASLECDLQDEKLVRRATAFENMVLSEVYRQPTASRTLATLLKHILPHANQGFTGYFSYTDKIASLKRLRGTISPQGNLLPIPDSLWNKIVQKDHYVLEVQDVEEDIPESLLGYFKSIPYPQIYFFPIRNDDRVIGILVTSDLPQVNVPHNLLISMTGKILHDLSFKLKDSLSVEYYEQELQITKEMLMLRNIADMQYESPLNMIETYLKKLCQLNEADRFSLYLSTADSRTGHKSLISGGIKLQSTILTEWEKLECRLVDYVMQGNQALCANYMQLLDLNVDQLIGSAILIPLFQQQRPMGVLCLTRSDSGDFLQRQFDLSKWAGSFLGETILKALTLAVTEREARLDPLTELANRRTFDQVFDRELRSSIAHGRECSLCLIDIDNFKHINDNYGHPAGDEVLRQISRILKEQSAAVRATDRPIVARYGGEEFALLLPNMGIAGANRIVEGIRSIIDHAPIMAGNKTIHVTISGGISTHPRHASTIQEMIDLADRALYQAKTSGRNRIVMATTHNNTEIASDSSSRLKLEKSRMNG
jgi:diguanylate cyclase (GGDEF)-like protein